MTLTNIVLGLLPGYIVIAYVIYINMQTRKYLKRLETTYNAGIKYNAEAAQDLMHLRAGTVSNNATMVDYISQCSISENTEQKI